MEANRKDIRNSGEDIDKGVGNGKVDVAKDVEDDEAYFYLNYDKDNNNNKKSKNSLGKQ